MKVYFDAMGNPHTPEPTDVVSWRIAGYALVLVAGKLLVVTPGWGNQYQLPGGSVDMEETLTEAIIRECYEETGYTIARLSDLPVHVSESNFYHTVKKRFFHSLSLFYEAELVSENQDKRVVNSAAHTGEIADVDWRLFHELDETNCSAYAFQAIKALKLKL